MKAFKGFNKDLTCRGFQYKVGETYEEEKAELCNTGFHACESPVDCLQQYNPSTSVYHEVELEEVLTDGRTHGLNLENSSVQFREETDNVVFTITVQKK